MIILKNDNAQQVCLFHCHNLLQHLKKLLKSVSVKKNNLKFWTVASTKDTH